VKVKELIKQLQELQKDLGEESDVLIYSESTFYVIDEVNDCGDDILLDVLPRYLGWRD